jgi:hypothetical protein
MCFLLHVAFFRVRFRVAFAEIVSSGGVLFMKFAICNKKLSNLQLFFGNPGFDFSCQIDYNQPISSFRSQLRGSPLSSLTRKLALFDVELSYKATKYPILHVPYHRANFSGLATSSSKITLPFYHLTPDSRDPSYPLRWRACCNDRISDHLSCPIRSPVSRHRAAQRRLCCVCSSVLFRRMLFVSPFSTHEGASGDCRR